MAESPPNYANILKSFITILIINGSIILIFMSSYYMYYNPNNSQKWDILLKNELINGSGCGLGFYSVVSVADLIFDENMFKKRELETGRSYDFWLMFKVRPFDMAKVLPANTNSYNAIYDSTLNINILLMDIYNKPTNNYFTTVLLPTKKDLGFYYYWQYLVSFLNVILPFYVDRNLIYVKTHIKAGYIEQYEKMHGLRYLINHYPNLSFFIFVTVTLSVISVISSFMIAFYVSTLYQRTPSENNNRIILPYNPVKDESHSSDSLSISDVKEEIIPLNEAQEGIVDD